MDASVWDERHAREDRLANREPNRFLVAAVTPLTPGTALALAAGQGRNAVWLAEAGWRVTALDYSRVALDKAAALAAERGVDLQIEHADLREWSPGRRFDLVTTVYLQLPEGEREAVWRAAAAAVAPGGHLLVVGHDARNLEEGYGGPSRAAVLYTAAEVAAVVGEVLQIERSETVVRPVEVEDGTRYAIDNLVLARAPLAVD
ncbi:MAG: methyltransferase domain-containing protein [Actinobacteria bacterium]|nr:methyltransferase domain-containing protein [Actinomycetota bacterium]